MRTAGWTVPGRGAPSTGRPHGGSRCPANVDGLPSWLPLGSLVAPSWLPRGARRCPANVDGLPSGCPPGPLAGQCPEGAPRPRGAHGAPHTATTGTTTWTPAPDHLQPACGRPSGCSPTPSPHSLAPACQAGNLGLCGWAGPHAIRLWHCIASSQASPALEPPVRRQAQTGGNVQSD